MTIPLEVVDTLPSTSEALKLRAAAGAGECALLALEQTAGRGRLGRGWTTMPGNLHLSVLLRAEGPMRPGHYATLCAVAAAEALRPYCPGLRLKWPNDVLADGGKLAGILLETDGTGWLVAGFGVNLGEAPTGLGRAVAGLGRAVSPEAFAPMLLAALERWRAAYEREGYGKVRDAWLAAGPSLGTELAAGPATGRFAGLDADGALLLDTVEGRRRVVAGEVSYVIGPVA